MNELLAFPKRPPRIVIADHPYHQAKAQGVVPEEFGIENPYEERFGQMARGDLIERIIELERIIDNS